MGWTVSELANTYTKFIYFTDYKSLLKTISMSTVSKIYQSMFFNCSALTSVSFPKCTTIGSKAFQGCSSLTTAYFPKCTQIQYWAFFGCRALTSVSFPECTIIEEQALHGCSSLTTISFPKCTSIGYGAFQNCSSLTTAYIGISKNTVCTLGARAFDYTNIQSIYVPASLVNNYKAATNWSAFSSIIFGI